MKGIVSLVGAGPGDPELLTVKAARRLSSADVVFYDALVSPEVLGLACHARLVGVGKRAGRSSTPQESIHRLLIDRASRGDNVVRLKGGDPFVFGRGGEEALALSRAGVPFEVIPGITSAIAAPQLFGIPLTHRGLSSAFVVVSGHARKAYRPVLESLTPHSATLVVLMGLARRAELATFLIEQGWNPRTPVATVLRGSTPQATAALDALTDWRHQTFVPDGPGTLVIGEVVSLARHFAELATPPITEKIGVTA